jgi:hypothetical protein
MRQYKTRGETLAVDEFEQMTFQDHGRVERANNSNIKDNEQRIICDCGTEHWRLDPCPLCGEE